MTGARRACVVLLAVAATAQAAPAQARPVSLRVAGVGVEVRSGAPFDVRVVADHSLRARAGTLRLTSSAGTAPRATSIRLSGHAQRVRLRAPAVSRTQRLRVRLCVPAVRRCVSSGLLRVLAPAVPFAAAGPAPVLGGGPAPALAVPVTVAAPASVGSFPPPAAGPPPPVAEAVVAPPTAPPVPVVAPAAPVAVATPAAPPPPPSGFSVRECGAAPLPTSGPAGAFAAMWDRSGEGWTGGDATLSVGLPDGRIAWVFGDTFLGGVRDGLRPLAEARIVRNSIVVQDGACLTTLAGGTAAAPTALAEPAAVAPAVEAWAWPGQPFLEDGRLRVPLAHVERTGEGPWDFASTGTDVASFSLPDLTPLGSRTLTTGPIAFTAAVVDDGPFTYVFGVEDRPAVKALHVARAPRGHVATAPWEHWTGAGWSSDVTASKPVATGVSDQLSVVRDGDGWLLLTQTAPFGDRIVALRADRPEGRWGAPAEIARLDVPDGGYAYNAVAHPELGTDGGLLMSFNVNALRAADLETHPELYRPRFVRVAAPAAVAR